MAQTHREDSPDISEVPAPAYTDNDLIISVSGKDATLGHRYILPAPKLPSSLDIAHVTAALSGWYREAITPAQNAATKAAKDGKSVRETVAVFLRFFKPSEDRTLPTVGEKRKEIARELLKPALAARGASTSDANVEENLAPFMQAKGAEIQAALDAFLTEPYKVTKRTGGAKGEGGGGTALEW